MTQKNDLSHWDVRTDFVADEVAALAMGKDPAGEGYVPNDKRPLYQRMENSYDAARKWRKPGDDDEEPRWEEYGVTNKPEILSSVGMRHQLDNWDADEGRSLSNWLADDELSGFRTQRFAREEIARWLAAIEVQSRYIFESNQSGTETNIEKPLGSKERNTLLRIIAALCKDCKYDYTKAAKTAALIKSTADSMDISIGETTIEEHLKKIPDVL